ncbi:MAG TPA: dienelactone hydrolase family protein [Gammaproteobacteria bacterium]|nr:dienelactone hydrolase family protein [Gammaproteobacteria bacterium]
MKKLRPGDLDREVYELYDRYVHHDIGRREFLSRLSKYTVTGLTAAAIFEFLAPDYARAQQVKPDDPRLRPRYVPYYSARGTRLIRALLAHPAGHAEKKLPGVVVVHENRGLNPYIEDVTRRLALAGYVALGPDALTPFGGYPGDDERGRELQAKRDRFEMLEDFVEAFNYLKAHPLCTGKVGVIGFCFGGWIANMMATRLPGLAAAAPFYGMPPPLEEVPAIQAPLLLHFAENDSRVNEGWPAYEDALKKNGKKYKAYLYKGANHGFHNDTTPRYDTGAAERAWQRTLKFFKKNLQ